MLDLNSIQLKDITVKGEYDVHVDDSIVSDIAIIGIGVNLPGADTVEEFWHNLRTGFDGVRDIPTSRKKDVDNYFACLGKESKAIRYGQAAYLEDIDKFDYNFFKISPKEASLLDPNQRLFLQVAWSAIEDSGYGGKKLEGSNTGVYLGFGSDSDYKKIIHEVDPESLQLSMPGNVRPIIASRISYITDLKGPSMIVDTTCSSSLVAVHLACQALRNGECDMAIAGGVQIHLLPVRDFEVGIESSTSRTRAFDDSSDGTGTGEGVIAIMLKPLTKAIEDRDNIYSVIKSTAVNQDGNSPGITAPNAEAQEELIVDAWNKAGIHPETISYIEAHGTGTKLGDPIEVEGIQRAFQRYTDRKQFCAIGSVKSNIGHLDNTSGIVGLLKAVISLKYKELFPTLHFKRPNRKINFESSPLYVNDQLKKWEVGNDKRRCGVSSFGLSGTNCHVIMEEAPEQVTSAPVPRNEIFLISAKTETSINKLVRRFISYLHVHKEINIADLCYTLSTGRGHYNYRLAIIAKSTEDLLEKLNLIERNGLNTEYGSTMQYNEFSLQHVANKEQTLLAHEQIINYLATERQETRILQEVATLYVQGADIEWESLYRREKRYRLHLPAYSFVKNRCWLDIQPRKNISTVENKLDRFYTSTWEIKDLQKVVEKKPIVSLLINDGHGVGTIIAEKLRKDGETVIKVEAGETFKKINEEAYIIAGDINDYNLLIKDIDWTKVTRVIHICSLSGNEYEDTLDNLEQGLERGVYSLFYLIKALTAQQISNGINIKIVTTYAVQVSNERTEIRPERSALFGLGKVIGWENKTLHVNCIDIDDKTDLDNVINEFRAQDKEYKVAYRNNKRYVERLISKNFPSSSQAGFKLQTDGVYIITGGAGGIGLEIATFLAAKEKITLALLNRSPLPKGSISPTGDRDRQLAQFTAMKNIEQMGAKLEYIQADITDEEQLKTAIALLKNRYGKINGVVHAAGIAEGDLLRNLSLHTFKKVMAPKVQGTWLLNKYLHEEDLQFFVLFSSAITLIGGLGSGPYTAANAFMDAFPSYRGSKIGKTMVINWPSWQKTSLADNSSIVDEKKELFSMLSPEDAVKAFYNAIQSDSAQMFIGNLNVNSDVFELGDFLPFRLSPKVREEIVTGNVNTQDMVPTGNQLQVKLKGKSSAYTYVEKQIAKAWRQVLGYEELDVNDNFFDIGGDSIMITRVHSIIDKEFPNKATIADLFSYPTVAKLSEHISKDDYTSSSQPKVSNNVRSNISALFERVSQEEITIEQAITLYRAIGVKHG
ncbi:Ketoacyl-synthetase C-terminal extension [Paenibacillus sp. cl6col]|uniref:type I polyketide synthase n=1 Tax=Paenibacillus sp. cl6col TaxID=1761878 RepID=UPI000885F63F|nr:type I polyketide synthase [Paenibacillus sp. cl6col]SDF67281.1 Ketoacyl-synthetase C-terminal extension [Paenibacillus sp. cl6col]